MMIQNVAIHAMNKGQFLAVAVTGLLALIIWKSPQQFSGDVVQAILRNLTQMKGISYILNIVLVVGWAWHMRWVTRENAGELDRIGREKTQLQEIITNRNLAGPGQNGPRNET